MYARLGFNNCMIVSKRVRLGSNIQGVSNIQPMDSIKTKGSLRRESISKVREA